MTTATETTESVELRDVRGPSALGGGTRRFFELLYLISVMDFKRTYFGTVLGYVWSLLRPLLTFAVLLFVFTKIFNLGARGSGISHYPEMLLFNIVLFSFFAEATGQAVGSVVGNEGIVRKTQFPRLVIPMSPVCTSLFNYGMNMIAVVIFLIAFGVEPMWTWLLFPVILLAMFVLASALALLLSTLYVRFRDVAIIWSVVSTALMYGTPVIYPLQYPPVPVQYHQILLINPLTPIFVQARKWMIDNNAPGALTTAGGWLHLLPAIAIYVAICVLGVWVFTRDAPRVAEEL
jgi:ABC-2 type transport system permease protein